MKEIELALDIVVEGGAWDEAAMETLAFEAMRAALASASDAPRDPVEISLLLTDDEGIRDEACPQQPAASGSNGAAVAVCVGQSSNDLLL